MSAAKPEEKENRPMTVEPKGDDNPVSHEAEEEATIKKYFSFSSMKKDEEENEDHQDQTMEEPRHPELEEMKKQIQMIKDGEYARGRRSDFHNSALDDMMRRSHTPTHGKNSRSFLETGLKKKKKKKVVKRNKSNMRVSPHWGNNDSQSSQEGTPEKSRYKTPTPRARILKKDKGATKKQIATNNAKLQAENKKLKSELAIVKNRLHMSIKESQKHALKEQKLKRKIVDADKLTNEYKKDRNNKKLAVENLLKENKTIREAAGRLKDELLKSQAQLEMKPDHTQREKDLMRIVDEY